MFEIYYKETYSCYENMMYTVLANLNKNHEMIFSECLGFHYHTVSEGKNKIVLSAKRGKAFSNLKQYCGLKVKVESLDLPTNFVEQICVHLDNGFVCGVLLDLFFCPWCEGYKRYHMDHYIIIERYDKETNKFICRDPHFHVKEAYLKKENLQACVQELLVMEVLESKPMEQQDCYQLIRNSASRFNEESFQQMRQFAKDLVHYNIAELIEGYDAIEYCPWFIHLLRICWARNNYIEFLEYLNTILPSEKIEGLKNEWMKVWSEWKSVKLIFTKCCVMPEVSSGKLLKLSKKVNAISDMEEKLVRKMILF